MWRRGWLTAGPALLVVSPLIGFSFQGDEKRNVYLNARRIGANPIEAAHQAYDEIDLFLRLGNFRPVGRFLDYTEHSFVFEAAEATGVAPHVVHGVVRLLMVALVAVLALATVDALMRSAGADPSKIAARRFTPLVVGVVLVAGGPESPIVHFPFLFLASAALILAIPLLIARDRDMSRRTVGPAEVLLLAGAGVVAAATFDLVYVAPPLAVTFVGLRGFVGGWPMRAVVASAAARRLMAFSVGFLLVFVPVRIEIAGRCGDGSCYSGSDIHWSSEVFGLLAGRMATGAPPSGWAYNGDLAAESGLGFGLRDLGGNALLALLIVGVVVLVVRAARSGEHARLIGWPRLATALGAYGLVLALLGSTLVSLSGLIQRRRPSVGEGWRDTVIVELGWAFVVVAALVVVVAVAEALDVRRPIVGLAAVVLGCGIVATMLANERLARTDRRDPVAAVTNQISSASIDFDLSLGGNRRRCDLIDAYAEFFPDPDAWIGGPQLSDELDRLMLGRHGRVFCDPSLVVPSDT